MLFRFHGRGPLSVAFGLPAAAGKTSRCVRKAAKPAFYKKASEPILSARPRSGQGGDNVSVIL
jgi:hypothetical protein